MAPVRYLFGRYIMEILSHEQTAVSYVVCFSCKAGRLYRFEDGDVEDGCGPRAMIPVLRNAITPYPCSMFFVSCVQQELFLEPRAENRIICSANTGKPHRIEDGDVEDGCGHRAMIPVLQGRTRTSPNLQRKILPKYPLRAPNTSLAPRKPPSSNLDLQGKMGVAKLLSPKHPP